MKEVATLSVWSSTPANIVWDMSYMERSVMGDVIKEKLDMLYGKNGVARMR